MLEVVEYILFTETGLKNPDECAIYEKFNEKEILCVRYAMQKVPKKAQYVIMRYTPDLPEILDTCSNIKTASNKILAHSLKYVQDRINKEKLPLFINHEIVNRTDYGKERFEKVKKRLEKLV
ncbi:hypothetical protein GOV14_01870 [Candidatus Pacearchaeota archaeon]|nr:hypothetical protein [Candidatus Pacearchaeota archaeon]